MHPLPVADTMVHRCSLSSHCGKRREWILNMSVQNKIREFLLRKSNVTYYWKLRNNAKNSKFKLRRYYNIFLLNKYHTRFNAMIPLSAQISDMPYFPHGLNGILVSTDAKIGKDCVIFHQVTIGSNRLADSNFGAPNIGDNVYIGAGAKIIGNVCIGDNVRIGANCVVVKDISDNSTVVLQSPRIIEHSEDRDNAFHA